EKKPGRARFFSWCDSWKSDQLRSALVFTLVVVGSVVAPLAPIVLLELDVSAAVLEPLLLGVEPPVPALVPELFGVPVLPMGVAWVLCCPAPAAGSLAAELGGVLWAMAEAAMPAAAMPASRPLKRVDAVIWKLLDFRERGNLAGLIASSLKAIGSAKKPRQPLPCIAVRRCLPRAGKLL